MVRLGRLDLGEGMHTPKSAMTLNEELIQLRQQVKMQEKEIRRLNHSEDEYNDSYERIRMYQALCLRSPEGINIPSERPVYRVIK